MPDQPSGPGTGQDPVASSNQHLSLILPRKRHSWMNGADTGTQTNGPPNPRVASSKRSKHGPARQPQAPSGSGGQVAANQSLEQHSERHDMALLSPAQSNSSTADESSGTDRPVFSTHSRVSSREATLGLETRSAKATSAAAPMPNENRGERHITSGVASTPAQSPHPTQTALTANVAQRGPWGAAAGSSGARDGSAATQGPGHLPGPTEQETHARNVKTLMDGWLRTVQSRKSSYRGGWSSGIEEPRYQTLVHACSGADPFYVILHQVFCLWTLKPGNARLLIPLSYEDTDAAFQILSNSFLQNKDINPLHLQWFATFPLDFSDGRTATAYTQELQGIGKFLGRLKTHWPVILETLKQTQVPFTGQVIIAILQCQSDTLADVFLLFSLSALNIIHEPYLSSMRQIFKEDLLREKAVLSTYTDPDALKQARCSTIQQYRAFIFQEASKTASQTANTRRADNDATTDQNLLLRMQGSSAATRPNDAAAASPSPRLGSNPQANRRVSHSANTHTHPEITNQAPPDSGHGPRGAEQRTLPPPRSFLTSQAPRNLSVSIPPTGNQFRTYAQPYFDLNRAGMAMGRPSGGLPGQQPSPSPNALSQPAAYAGQQARTQYHPMLTGQLQQATQQINRNSWQNRIVAHDAVRPSPPSTVPQAAGSQPHGLHRNPQRLTGLPTGFHLMRMRSPTRMSPNSTAEMHYSFIEDVVTEVTVLSAQWGLRELCFEIPQEEHPNLARTFEQNGLPISRYMNGSTRYRFRICTNPASAKLPSHSQWTALPCSWPQNTAIVCNEMPTTLRRKAHFGQDMALELTDMVVGGTNKIQISLSDVKGNHLKDRVYIGAVERLRVLSRTSVSQLVLHSPHASKSDTQLKIRHRLKPSDSEDVVVQGGAISVSLVDPFSAALVLTPVRGKDCLHLECFDLDNWLETRPKKQGAAMGEPSVVDAWKCPICGLDARPVSLIVDNFILGIVQSLIREKKDGVKMVEVDAEANWTPVQESESALEQDPAQPQRRTMSVSAPPPETIEIEDD